MVLFVSRLSVTMSPITSLIPFRSIPSSSEYTDIFMREVADSPYGSQFDMMLNQA